MAKGAHAAAPDSLYGDKTDIPTPPASAPASPPRPMSSRKPGAADVAADPGSAPAEDAAAAAGGQFVDRIETPGASSRSPAGQSMPLHADGQLAYLPDHRSLKGLGCGDPETSPNVRPRSSTAQTSRRGGSGLDDLLADLIQLDDLFAPASSQVVAATTTTTTTTTTAVMATSMAPVAGPSDWLEAAGASGDDGKAMLQPPLLPLPPSIPSLARSQVSHGNGAAASSRPPVSSAAANVAPLTQERRPPRQSLQSIPSIASDKVYAHYFDDWDTALPSMATHTEEPPVPSPPRQSRWERTRSPPRAREPREPVTQTMAIESSHQRWPESLPRAPPSAAPAAEPSVSPVTAPAPSPPRSASQSGLPAAKLRPRPIAPYVMPTLGALTSLALRVHSMDGPAYSDDDADAIFSGWILKHSRSSAHQPRRSPSLVNLRAPRSDDDRGGTARRSRSQSKRSLWKPRYAVLAPILHGSHPKATPKAPTPKRLYIFRSDAPSAQAVTFLPLLADTTIGVTTAELARDVVNEQLSDDVVPPNTVLLTITAQGAAASAGSDLLCPPSSAPRPSLGLPSRHWDIVPLSLDASFAMTQKPIDSEAIPLWHAALASAVAGAKRLQKMTPSPAAASSTRDGGGLAPPSPAPPRARSCGPEGLTDRLAPPVSTARPSSALGLRTSPRTSTRAQPHHLDVDADLFPSTAGVTSPYGVFTPTPPPSGPSARASLFPAPHTLPEPIKARTRYDLATPTGAPGLASASASGGPAPGFVTPRSSTDTLGLPPRRPIDRRGSADSVTSRSDLAASSSRSPRLHPSRSPSPILSSTAGYRDRGSRVLSASASSPNLSQRVRRSSSRPPSAGQDPSMSGSRSRNRGSDRVNIFAVQPPPAEIV
ncbi:hypothetical protein CXG81DRAFT_18301 [Caulochytrium protostelioides]|uniref:Uncharacterized protein n=1 Tax=Caulochytrium protostelioides TaxID=1555241 RepID=A0A4V1IUW8_9FUNG|nr:hypothetical protein CXG81DRAFT_18301 [Caulochytrium protostelioides]|eukprot:RKP02009.1 hypothetical protein CXG81DRAFT_18301 [Caulochytrium protostelioides]